MAKAEITASSKTVDDRPELKPYTTISGRPIEPLYRPEDVAGIDYERDLGDPGSQNRLSRQDLDDAPVRGLWFGRSDQ
jgi:hypothetical protein